MRVDAVAKAMPQSGLTVVVNINTAAAGGGRCIMYGVPIAILADSIIIIASCKEIFFKTVLFIKPIIEVASFIL